MRIKIYYALGVKEETRTTPEEALAYAAQVMREGVHVGAIGPPGFPSVLTIYPPTKVEVGL